MSGGYFNYNQYRINKIADMVEKLILNNQDDKYQYPDEVIKEFKVGLEYLKKATIYAQRIDWLVSGDDGEESFLKRLEADLNMNEYKNKGK